VEGVEAVLAPALGSGQEYSLEARDSNMGWSPLQQV